MPQMYYFRAKRKIVSNNVACVSLSDACTYTWTRCVSDRGWLARRAQGLSAQTPPAALPLGMGFPRTVNVSVLDLQSSYIPRKSRVHENPTMVPRLVSNSRPQAMLPHQLPRVLGLQAWATTHSQNIFFLSDTQSFRWLVWALVLVFCTWSESTKRLNWMENGKCPVDLGVRQTRLSLTS